MALKISILSSSDLSGGAARAAYRLHDGLRRQGVVTRMFVQSKGSDDRDVVGPSTKFERVASRARADIDLLPSRNYRKVSLFSPAWLPNGKALKQALSIDPDVVNLHWINAGFVRIEQLVALKKPIVWTLHDMWPFSGGCHYDGGCGLYKTACGACPVLNSTEERDLSRKVFDRKMAIWPQLDLTIVTPSRWLAEEAAKSALFAGRRIEVIANPLDLGRYRPLNQGFARDVLGLPPDRRYIMFGAMDPASEKRKGFGYLQTALDRIRAAGNLPDLALLVVGKRPANAETLLPGVEAHYTGHLGDDISLSLAYSAADVFVAPSIQDNLPNTVAEALASGTPCVAFDIGGMPDMIRHQENGFLARPFDTEELAAGLTWVLSDQERLARLRRQARATAEALFDVPTQCRHYAGVFESLARRGA